MRINWIGIPAALILLMIPSLSAAQDSVENLTPTDDTVSEVVTEDAAAEETEPQPAEGEPLLEPDPGLDAPGSVTVLDQPNDAGNQLLVTFELPSDTENILRYNVYRRTSGDIGEDAWNLVKSIPAGVPAEFVDGFDPEYPIEPGVTYEYRIASVSSDNEEFFGPVFEADVVGEGEIFHTGKVRVLVAGALFIFLIFYYFGKAQRGAKMYLRPIAGIEAIDEAIGRA
ncbi:MAG: hypothetical protein K8R76_06605, partial [Candidatus Aegiribacteria sp.]|nr:hypothetical protein [Candidatus Aegiribacteria sp.]